MTRTRSIFSLFVAILGFFASSVHAQGTFPMPVTVWKRNLPSANGVAVGFDGAVYVASNYTLWTGDGGTRITKFASDGRQLGYLDIYGVFAGRLATDPGSGWIVGVHPDGRVFAVAPTLDRGGYLFNTRSISSYIPTATTAWNVAIGGYGYTGGAITPFSATYNDVAIVQRANQLDLLVTGYSGVTSFAVRIRMNTPSIAAAQSSPVPFAVKLLAFSSAVSGSHSPGIAVTQQGVALTTMPICIRYPCSSGVDAAVKFHVDFPETGAATPVATIAPFTSNGLTTGPNDVEFFAATGRWGIAGCGEAGAAAMTDTVVSSRYICFPISGLGLGFTPNTQDIAMSPDRRFIYMTHATAGIVIRYTN